MMGEGGKQICQTENKRGKTMGTWDHREIFDGNKDTPGRPSFIIIF